MPSEYTSVGVVTLPHGSAPGLRTAASLLEARRVRGWRRGLVLASSFAIPKSSSFTCLRDPRGCSGLDVAVNDQVLVRVFDGAQHLQEQS